MQKRAIQALYFSEGFGDSEIGQSAYIGVGCESGSKGFCWGGSDNRNC